MIDTVLVREKFKLNGLLPKSLFALSENVLKTAQRDFCLSNRL